MPSRSVEEIRERLYETAGDPGSDPATGALWIAAEEYPELDVDAYRGYLTDLAERVTRAVASDASADAVQKAMAQEIFETEGFTGNANDYYDPRNSYLNDVIDRRVGIPITLAVVYLSVARTLGRTASGLNTPGHFLVVDEGAVLDPFHGGRVVERDALLAQMEQAGSRQPSAQLEQILQNPTDTRGVLTRMLVNLRMNHLRRKDQDRALTAVDRLVHVDPENPTWLRDRGALFQRLDCPGAAVSDLKAYLERAPEDPEADVIQQFIDRLTRDLPPLQ
ncbi:MAG: tetratricopeptide repeat protein [Candidatus Binatia bacterium]|nr:tetratricopeptide repeat protein [Candidatus Binatia bacterium]